MSVRTGWYSVIPLLSLLLISPAPVLVVSAEESGGPALVTVGDVRVRLSDHGPVVLPAFRKLLAAWEADVDAGRVATTR